MILDVATIPLPFDFDVREDADALHALLYFRTVPSCDVDVLRVLASEMWIRFGRTSDDLDWSRMTLERFPVDRFTVHAVRVPKVAALLPLSLH